MSTNYSVRIRGQEVPDDGLEIDLGKTGPGGTYWGGRNLPACPDCGGMLRSAPAGKSHCDARCVGAPTGKTGSGVVLFDPRNACGSTFSIDPNRNGRVMLFRRRYHEITAIPAIYGESTPAEERARKFRGY